MTTLPMLERDVLAGIRGWLELRGYHVIRLQSGLASDGGRRFRIGEPGMPDLLALHYGKPDAVWIEVKRPADRRKCWCKPTSRSVCTVCAQANWRRQAELLGARVLQVASVEELRQQLE